MKYGFCTLFDSNYLDKGIAMIHSLSRHLDDFALYIFAFDRIAYNVLNSMNIPKVKTVLFEDIINDELKEIRMKRSRAEFCWTSTPYIIQYTLQNYDVDMCTYVDADIYFWNNPSILIEEMENQNCSVQIVEHRFPDYPLYRRIQKMSGKYCVQFNTFLNNEQGMRVLERWKRQCFECCTSDWRKGNFGDQKYLDDWTEVFEGIQVLENHGGGMAPWNVAKYKFEKEDNCGLVFKDRTSGRAYTLVFYHYHDLHFIQENRVKINVFIRPGKVDEKLIQNVYGPYIKELSNIRSNLRKQYGLELSMQDYNKKLLWTRDQELTLYEKIARILYLPVTLYQKVIKERKDIVCVKQK